MKDLHYGSKTDIFKSEYFLDLSFNQNMSYCILNKNILLIDLSYNDQLQEKDLVKYFPNLEGLILSYNKTIVGDELRNLHNLIYLDLSFNDTITDIVLLNINYDDRLIYLNLDYNTIISDTIFKYADLCEFEYNDDCNNPFGRRLQYLSLEGNNNITINALQKCHVLQFLNISQNKKLRSVELTKLYGLKFLVINSKIVFKKESNRCTNDNSNLIHNYRTGKYIKGI